MRLFHYLMCGVLGAALTWTAPPPLAAQRPTGTIRGRVTDNSTQTRDDGRFTIGGIAAGSDLLRVKMIGYVQINQPVMITAGDTSVVDLALTAQAIGLSEVVVTGYGQQRAGNITGAVTAVGDSQFNTGRVISPQMLIQNKVAGVQVVDNNDPGGGLSIR